MVRHTVDGDKEAIKEAFRTLYCHIEDEDVYELWFKESSNMDPEVSLAS